MHKHLWLSEQESWMRPVLSLLALLTTLLAGVAFISKLWLSSMYQTKEEAKTLKTEVVQKIDTDMSHLEKKIDKLDGKVDKLSDYLLHKDR